MTSATRIQVCVRAKTQGQRISFLKLERDGRGHLIQPPSPGGGATSGWAASFPLAASPGLGIVAYCYQDIGFLQSCVCVILRGYSFGFWDRENELSDVADAWPQGLPWNNFTISTLLCFYSICRVHLFYVLIHSANTFKLFLSISCWTPLSGLSPWGIIAFAQLTRKFQVEYKAHLTFLPFCLLSCPWVWCSVWMSILHFDTSEFLFHLFSILCNSPNILNRIMCACPGPSGLEWGHVIDSGSDTKCGGVCFQVRALTMASRLSKQEFWRRNGGWSSAWCPWSDYTKHNILLTMF